MKLNCLILALISGALSRKILDTSQALLSRQRRFLVWKEGINWVQLIVGIGLPIEVQDQAITLGSVAKAYYLLPNNSSQITRPSVTLLRRKRSDSTTRWAVYSLIESFLTRYGFGDGKACLLKAICDAASHTFDDRGGILTEILHAVLSPSSTPEMLEGNFNADYLAAEDLGKQGRNCSLLFFECKTDILDKFSELLNK